MFRDALDAYTVEIEPLVRTYRQVSNAAYGKSGLLNAASRLAREGDLEAARERGREFIALSDRVVDAALPIRAAHDRFVATVSSRLKPEQARAFQRATSLLWSPRIRHDVLLLLRIERGLHRDDLPAARRRALEENHTALEKIINEKLGAINAVRPRFRDAAWQHAVFQSTVDWIIANATGAEPPTPPESLPDDSTIWYQHFDDLNRIEAAVDRYLPSSDKERQP